MEKVLLLGGTRHLSTSVINKDYGSPISVPNGVGARELYHRAVFFPQSASSGGVSLWFIYVTDEYQISPGQLSATEILAELEAHAIPPAIKSTPVENLTHEKQVSLRPD